jgi:hypothetical protein
MKVCYIYILQNIKVFTNYITESSLNFGSAPHHLQNTVARDAQKKFYRNKKV